MKKLTYAEAGVDIDAGAETVEKIKGHVKSTLRPECMGDLGGFGGAFALDKDKYEEPVLISGTDGVGTKLKLAFLMDKHDTIGIDAVAMCVNDILVQGAEPLFFLDYLAVGKLNPDQAERVVAGIAEGCRQAGCALIGGETAEMPGFYPAGEYDVAGFSVGVVDRKNLITGDDIEAGDVILGLPSTGLHSNGFSLARKALLGDEEEHQKEALSLYEESLGSTLGEAMLRPTRIYVKPILKLMQKVRVKGLAHITGGGLTDNVPRILPNSLDALIARDVYPVPEIFNLIAERGNVDRDEMYRAFNMGIGMVLVVSSEDADQTVALLEKAGEKVYTLGSIAAGEGRVVYR
ncbi:phosphoribosylformylglycinamidine cyclo-ligase [Clostridia bacterium]|nr:phosphoribosylformylglycinamidine cyclo-ligase [Clostridia bacterium]